tara:strand:+ start:1569 stop:1748 length:180 start_codon:yes stop_codon:yes gene_type:complete
MNAKQVEAIEHIHKWHDVKMSLADFIKSAQKPIGYDDGSYVVFTGRIYIGIEPDGSRHS